MVRENAGQNFGNSKALKKASDIIFSPPPTWIPEAPNSRREGNSLQALQLPGLEAFQNAARQGTTSHYYLWGFQTKFKPTKKNKINWDNKFPSKQPKCSKRFLLSSRPQFNNLREISLFLPRHLVVNDSYWFAYFALLIRFGGFWARRHHQLYGLQNIFSDLFFSNARPLEPLALPRKMFRTGKPPNLLKPYLRQRELLGTGRCLASPSFLYPLPHPRN